MSAHTPTASHTAPWSGRSGRSHRGAGPAAWVLGTISTCLSTFFVTQVVYSAVNGELVGLDSRSVVLLMGAEAVMLAIFWLAFLVFFLPLRHDGAVTGPALYSATLIGVVTGGLLLLSSEFGA